MRAELERVGISPESSPSGVIAALIEMLDALVILVNCHFGQKGWLLWQQLWEL